MLGVGDGVVVGRIAQVVVVVDFGGVAGIERIVVDEVGSVAETFGSGGVVAEIVDSCFEKRIVVVGSAVGAVDVGQVADIAALRFATGTVELGGKFD